VSGARTIAAVVVTLDGGPTLARCLDSLLLDGRADHVIVVDNGAPDLDLSPDVVVVRPGRNVGFGAGANAGAQRAFELGVDAIALLNDDVEVTRGWLDELDRLLDETASIGAVQPMLVLADTDPVLVNSLGVVVGPDGAGNDLGFEGPAGEVPADPVAIEIFTGGAVLLSKAFIEATGGFDERYFLYYEDVDLARRGSALGWRYLCQPAARVAHRPSSSTTQLGDRRRFFQERNRLWSAFRNEPPSVIARALWLSVRRLRHPPRGTHSTALVAGVAGAPVRLFERWRRIS
jgi:GT2 family glycosyltransferase